MADDIDLSLLSKAEIVEYNRVVAEPSKVNPAGTIAGAVVLWLAATIGAFVFTAVIREDSKVFADVIMTPACFVIMIVGGFMVWAKISEGMQALKKEREQRINNFRYSIHYVDRVDRARRTSTASSSSSDDGRDYRTTWMTGNYDPARYYSYDKSQRDYMKMMDMDADTYDSNVDGRE